jgi:hypothetical protein
VNRELDCWNPNCRAQVTLSDRQYQHFKATGDSFYCSAGHSQVFRPSENSKLRDEVRELKRSLEMVRRQRDVEENTWRCPFGGCYYSVGSKGSLVRHINNHHRLPKLLPSNAGPDALNSEVA